MSASSKPFLVALDLEGKEQRLNLCLASPSRFNNGVCIVKRSRTISRKRRNLLGRSRRPRNVLAKWVRTLRRLVPSTEPVGLDGLFRDTAAYIVALKLRVKLMQDLVDMLAGSDE